MTNFANIAPNATYKVMDTLQAAGADFVVDKRYLKIGNPAQIVCEYPLIVPGATTLTPSVDGTAQVTTLTPTAVANTTYTFSVQQWNPALNGGSFMFRQYSYTTAASGDTATTICNAFRTQLAADTAQGVIQITGSGSSTLIMTAVSGYWSFTVAINVSSSLLTQSTGTAAVESVGTTADLALQGIVVTGTNYTTWNIVYGYRGSNVNTLQDFRQSVYTVYINEDATNYAAALAKIKDLMTNTGPGSSTAANPETLALLDS